MKEVLAEIGKQKQGYRTDLLPIVGKRLEVIPHNTQRAIAEKIGWSKSKVAMAEVVAKNAPIETLDKRNRKPPEASRQALTWQIVITENIKRNGEINEQSHLSFLSRAYKRESFF